MSNLNRRQFLGAAIGAGLSGSALPLRAAAEEKLYEISLAQWSLNEAFFDGEIDALDFPKTARSLGIGAVEYVNQFFMDRARDQEWLGELKQRAQDENVESLLIMCDNEGHLGNPDKAARLEAVENHYKWVDAARFLGCHSIRVNARSEGTYEEQRDFVADGLSRLVEYADDRGINVIIENHGGLSSNAQWVVDILEQIDHPKAGTLPDFGNFRISDDETYDSYQGVREMMPYAKGVSAKSHGYDARGNRIAIDYERMMRIVLDAGYRGYVGIESGGGVEGVVAMKRALESARRRLKAHYAG